jgi:hypothetical protein
MTDIVNVDVPATDSEDKMRSALREMRDMESERNSMTADYNKRIKDIKTLIYGMLNDRPTKPVQCTIHFNWENGMKEWIASSGDVLKSVPISESERQTELPLDIPVTATQEPEAAPEPAPEVVEEIPIVDSEEVSPEEIEERDGVAEEE